MYVHICMRYNNKTNSAVFERKECVKARRISSLSFFSRWWQERLAFRVIAVRADMSLALVQAYSSEEEEEAEVLQSSDAESDDGGATDTSVPTFEHQGTTSSVCSTLDSLLSSSSSLLPSAAMVFSEVTGPPDYLKDSMGYLVSIQPPKTLAARPQKDHPAGAIVESKPQLFGLPEHVRTDQSKAREESRSLKTAGMPSPDDAAKLLGVCLQCGVPKTYSAVKEGLVCPVCKDRQVSHNDADSKRRGSKIKDKERNKRVKGQSSHATWKSETEMHLRQQFD